MENWCPPPESNRHSRRNGILNPARLPIPPEGHVFGIFAKVIRVKTNLVVEREYSWGFASVNINSLFFCLWLYSFVRNLQTTQNQIANLVHYMDETQSQQGAFDKIEQVLVEAQKLNEQTPTSHVTLGELSDGMQERAFGLLILLLALPCALPFVYGLPQLVALPMLVLTFQMARGLTSPWLPQTLRKRRLSIQSLLNVLRTTRKYAGWLERLAHPRLVAISSASAQRVIGAFMLVPCLSILVPLPLTNTVPGIAVGIAAVGLIQRDALFIIFGLIMGFLWVSLLVIGGPALVYYIIDFFLNQKA